MHTSRLFAVAAAAAFLPLAALGQSAPASMAAAPSAVAPASLAASPNLVATGNITTTLKSSASFTILSKALDAANMSEVLAKTPGLTLFAPTDAAFKALPSAQLVALLDPKNVATLQQVLTYHLVNLDLPTAKFKGAKGPVQTVEHGNIVLDGSGSVAKVNDANIIQPDVRAGNGMIQVIDKVLIPTDVKVSTAAASVETAAASGR